MSKSIYVFFLIVGFIITGCDANSITEEESPVAPAALGGDHAYKKNQDCGCRNIEAELLVTLNPETLVTEGTIRGDINGSVGLIADPSSIAPVSGDLYPPLEPQTVVFMGQATLATQRGDLMIRVAGVSESVAGGVSAQFGKITGGTGRYSNATGTFFFAAENLRESGLTSRLDMEGQICYMPKSCE
ncbi:MAG: hypothetical protein AB8G77_24020 [Rhodothermales bacterium]